MTQSHSINDSQRVHVIASITTGILPSIFMFVALAAVMFYLWEELQIHRRSAALQVDAINSASVEGRVSHQNQGRLLRRMAVHVGMDPSEVDQLLPRTSVEYEITPNILKDVYEPSFCKY